MKKKTAIIIIVALILFLALFLVWKNISGNVIENSSSAGVCGEENPQNSTNCSISINNAPAKVQFDLNGQPIKVV